MSDLLETSESLTSVAEAEPLVSGALLSFSAPESFHFQDISSCSFESFLQTVASASRSTPSTRTLSRIL